jgi:hypothetical protein
MYVRLLLLLHWRQDCTLRLNQDCLAGHPTKTAGLTQTIGPASTATGSLLRSLSLLSHCKATSHRPCSGSQADQIRSDQTAPTHKLAEWRDEPGCKPVLAFTQGNYWWKPGIPGALRC